MPRVVVVIPWRPGCPSRRTALSWVLQQYAEHHADWPVIVAHAPNGAWIKALAAMPAITATDADIVIVADADVWTTGLPQAVRAVQDGAGWAMPHTFVCRLAEQATRDLLAGSEAPLTYSEPPYRGIRGGGIVIARRETLLDVPLDPRFQGWGQEDLAWAIALHTLAGPGFRGPDDLLHLWHPPQTRMNRKIGSAEGHALLRRYTAARRHPDRMRALIQEMHTCLSPPS